MTSHQYIIDKEKNDKDSENLSDVSRMLVKFSILEGELNKFIIDATDPEGLDGETINDLEKKRFSNLLKKLKIKY